MKTSREIRQEKGSLWNAMTAITDSAKAEGRDLSAEELSSWNKLDADMELIVGQLDFAEKHEARERENAEPIAPPSSGGGGSNPAESAKMDAFRHYILEGMSSLSPTELAALQGDNGPQGGYLVAPMEFVNSLIKAEDDLTFVRKYATIQQLTSSQSVGRPSLDADPADADWTKEIATGTEDSTMKFGSRELTPHPVAKRIKISNKLLRLSPSVEALVNDRLAYKFAITEEKAYLTGDGVDKPLGLFTASLDGIPTSRDVVVGGVSAITADGLIDVKYSLKAAYWDRARWLFHRDAIRGIRKLTTTTSGDYVWRPGLAGDAADTILDAPFDISEYVPNTFTTGLYVCLYGDLKQYWIAEALDMQLQVLDQLYAETNQTGYIGRKEIDGMPVLAEAFARGKLA